MLRFVQRYLSLVMISIVDKVFCCPNKFYFSGNLNKYFRVVLGYFPDIPWLPLRLGAKQLVWLWKICFYLTRMRFLLMKWEASWCFELSSTCSAPEKVAGCISQEAQTHMCKFLSCFSFDITNKNFFSINKVKINIK